MTRQANNDGGPLADARKEPVGLSTAAYAGAGEAVGTVPFADTAEASAGIGFSPRGIWAQSRWWIVGITAVICAAVVPAVWLTVTPVYEASALIRISPKALRIAFKNEDNSGTSYYRSFVNTQVSLLRGVNVLQRVLDQPRVRELSWYRESGRTLLGGNLSHLERLARAMTVKAYRDSELIEVTVSVKKAGDAKTLANAIVDEYKKLSDETIREADIQRYETLVEEHNRLQKEIDGLIRTKFTIAKQLGTATPEELRSQLSTHLGRLEQEHANLERALKLTEGDMEWLAQRGAARQPGPSESDALGDDDPNNAQYAADAEWRRLRMNVEDARHRLEVTRQDFGEEHPRIRQLRAAVEHAEKLLADRATQLAMLPAEADGASSGNRPAMNRETLGQQAERFRRQIALLKEELDLQRSKVATASDLAGDLAQYDEQIRRKRELYETLHARLTELELEGKAPARISIEAHSTEPSRPSGDRRIVYTVLAFGSAMFLAFGVGYVRFVLDPRVREAMEVRESVRAPFLGQLPPLPTTAKVFEGTTPFLLESIRMVRTALLQRLGESPGSVILVTSTTSRSGKSTVTALLGQSLSALGRRTLIVEADLRRPSLGERLGLSAREGLGALLCGTANGTSVVRPSGHARLDVALAGELPDEFDPEFLANGRFREALADWRKTYDFVLVDSPPVLPVADSRILAGMTDGVLLVLRSTHTRRLDVVQSIQDIHSSGGQLVGTVLVGTRYGSGYGYDAEYYGYAGHRPKALAVAGEVRV